MYKQYRNGILAGLAAIALSATSAYADKLDDTLRVNLYQPINVVDRLIAFQPEAVLVAGAVFDSLVQYDPESGEYKPSLATSWKRIDGKTLEFRLREDVTFHDGSKFDADDVVYTVGYVTDPNVQFPLKGTRYGWIEGAKKIDQYTVQISSKLDPFAPALSKLGDFLHIYPSDVHAKLPEEFGKNPIGTGPYKAVQVDPNGGIRLEAFDGYKLAEPWRPAAKIHNIELKPVPDRQTQMALMLSGQQDLMLAPLKEQAEALEMDPRYNLAVVPGAAFAYVQFDLRPDSPVKDERVRKALIQALDRKAIAIALTAGDPDAITTPDAMCPPILVACAYSTEPPAYDPAAAMKLLSEAGFPDGFDATIGTWGSTGPVAEAVAGYLRAVGVKATVDKMTFSNYLQRKAKAELPVSISEWTNAGQPDVDATTRFFFQPGPGDTFGDETVNKLSTEAGGELDGAKREKLYEELFDRVNEKAYVMPIIALPKTVVYSDEIAFKQHGLSPVGFWLNDLSWK